MILRKAIFYRITLIMVVGVLFGSSVHAQDNGSGVYIDPNKSDPRERNYIVISGNRVEMYIANWGQIANRGHGNPGGGVWPRGTNHDHLHMMTPYVAARVPGKDGNIHYVISESYMLEGTPDPITNIDQKLQPLPGYLNKNYINTVTQSAVVANQLDPQSWPASWPGKDSRWSGYWNGYFGLNQKNADQEAYFVMDDAWNTKLPFYPSIDTTRRGLGLQIEVRNFQWSHPLAQDVIFTHYQVTNVGIYDYVAARDSMYFGGYADFNAGGDGMTNDDASFDSTANMVYSWADKDQMSPLWNHREILPGYMGWKFLESPGIPNDGLDNDHDGLVDEKRDNPAGAYIFSPIGNYGPPTWHWEGDENGDWNPLTNDVGTDGIGPGDEGYPGADPDGTEGNGKPDQGEPRFGKTDKDESDQSGLSSFSAPNYGSIHIAGSGEELKFWPIIQKGYYRNPPQGVNQMWVFSSGPINLAPGKTERFSTCFAFGTDKNALYRAAHVAQGIYNAGYQFTKPPRQPKLKAVAGDHKVTLMWDALAEQSYDPIYHYDFEGYKVIRSTDPQFLDATVITDAFGTKIYMKSIAQFDLVDGLFGMHPVALGQETAGGDIAGSQGIHYYMGDDTGLQHFYVDSSSDIINGRTYYYAIVAYDKGYYSDFYQRHLSYAEFLDNISPSECAASIVVTQGIITHMDQNTAMATPNTNPSNYIKATTDGDSSAMHVAGVSTSPATVRVVTSDNVKDAKYILTFKDSLFANQVDYGTISYSVYDSTNHKYILQDIRIPRVKDTLSLDRNWVAELLDEGVVINLGYIYPTFNNTNAHSGWVGTPLTNIRDSLYLAQKDAPIQCIGVMIEWGDSNEVLDTAYTKPNYVNPLYHKRLVNFKITELGSGKKVPFLFEENPATTNGLVDTTESISIGHQIPGKILMPFSYKITFHQPIGFKQGDLFVPPQKGDKYIIKPMIPYSNRDVFEFNTTKASVIERASASSALSNITVVPNPYIESAIWEQQPYTRGGVLRKINFNNLPAKCTIRIYSLNGYLLREIRHEGSGAGLGTEPWDLTTKDGLEVATGLYIYHVDAEGIGSIIGKFVIVN